MSEQSITHQLREQIKMHIKNKLDISDLIQNVSLKNEDLSGAVIKYIAKIGCDLYGCNFSHSILGCEDKIFSLIQCNISNCNFEGCNFVGKAFLRSCVAKGCNFKNANVALVDYQHSDFSNSNFCGAIIRISTREGIGAKFPKSMFEDLMKGWSTKFKIVEEGE